MFLIYRCRRCGRFLIAKPEQKTKRCPSCNYMTDFGRVKLTVYARAKNSLEAIYLVQQLQEKYFGKKF
ncbi:MAG: DUF1922 domain-containing protein [Candidatus Thermoplasmatota archaeon]